MINIDLSNDSPTVIAQKIELMAKHQQVQRDHDSYQDRRFIFKIMFWILFIVLMIGGLWAAYVMSHPSQYGEGEKESAKFIFGTVGSAAVAALIGLLATQPK